MKKILYLLLVLLLPLTALAQQTIKGKVTDMKGATLPRAVLKAYSLSDAKKVVAYTLSDSKGEYQLKLPQEVREVNLTCTFMGFEAQTQKTSAGKTCNFRMKESSWELKEVVVKAPAMRASGDTLTYNVAQFKSQADRNLLDVIRKLPGITVETSGMIRYQNEPINKFYIEDMDMLDGRYNLATKNLNPDDIASVKVYENHQPQKVLKDHVLSNQAALNIKLKADRKSVPLGNLTLGAGAGKDVNFLAELFSMTVGARKQQLLTAKGNNFGRTYADEMGNNLQTASSQIRSQVHSAYRLVHGSIGEIPESRYNRNHSYAVTLNRIHRLSDDNTLRLNVSYQQQRNRFESATSVSYAGTQALVHGESTESRGTQHQLNLSGQYERNAASIYLRDQFLVMTDLVRNSQMVHAHGNEIQERQRMNSYALVNLLNFTTRKGERMFRFNSEVSFSNSPKGFMEVESDTELYPNLRQNLKGYNLYTRENTSLSHSLNTQWVLGTSLQVEGNYDRVETGLLAEQLPDSRNDVSGYKAMLQVSPYLEYKQGSRLEATWNLPVYYKLQGYRDAGSRHGDFTDNRLYAEPSFSVSYKPSAGLNMGLNAGWSQSFGDIRGFVTSPVYMSYRMRQAWGSGTLSEGKSFMVAPRLSYRNAMTGHFLSLSAQYVHGKNNLMAVSDVDESQESTAVLSRDNSSDQWQERLSYSKKFTGTTLKLDATAMQVQSHMLRQQQEYLTKTNMLTLRGQMQNDLAHDWIHTTLSVAWTCRGQQMSMERMSTESTLNQWNGSLRLSVTPSDALEFYLDNYLYWSQQTSGSYKRSEYLDGGVRWKLKALEIELSAQNLTDSRVYETCTYLQSDTYRYTYQLRPIEALLTFKFKL